MSLLTLTCNITTTIRHRHNLLVLMLALVSCHHNTALQPLWWGFKGHQSLYAFHFRFNITCSIATPQNNPNSIQSLSLSLSFTKIHHMLPTPLSSHLIISSVFSSYFVTILYKCRMDTIIQAHILVKHVRVRTHKHVWTHTYYVQARIRTSTYGNENTHTQTQTHIQFDVEGKIKVYFIGPLELSIPQIDRLLAHNTFLDHHQHHHLHLFLLHILLLLLFLRVCCRPSSTSPSPRLCGVWNAQLSRKCMTFRAHSCFL